MNCGDIYQVVLDPTAVREQRGHRPVLIVSATKFNNATGVPVVLPITNGGQFAQRLGFAVALVGTKTTGIVRCDQPRILDLKARQGKKIEAVTQEILDDVLAKVVTIFES